MARTKLKKLRIGLLAGFLAIGGCLGLGIAAPSQADAATPESLALLEYGKKYIGVPYLYGARAGSTSAFDCSSFVQYVFGKFDKKLPRTSVSQAYTGQKVAKSYLSVGDLVFFRTNGVSISHVAIYAGNNKILHSSSSKGVTISNMNTSYWKKAYVTARRVL